MPKTGGQQLPITTEVKRLLRLRQVNLEDHKPRPILILLVIISVSMLAQNAPVKAKLITADSLLEIKEGVYLINQGVFVVGERIKEVGVFEAVKARMPFRCCYHFADVFCCRKER